MAVNYPFDYIIYILHEVYIYIRNCNRNTLIKNKALKFSMYSLADKYHFRCADIFQHANIACAYLIYLKYVVSFAGVTTTTKKPFEVFPLLCVINQNCSIILNKYKVPLEGYVYCI